MRLLRLTAGAAHWLRANLRRSCGPKPASRATLDKPLAGHWKLGREAVPACIHCGQDSQYLTYDAWGLCHQCAPDHAPVIAQAVGGIAGGAEARSKARRSSAQLELLRDSIDHCRVLQRYPALRLEGVDPARLMADLEKVRTETVEEAIRGEWFDARERARDSAGTSGIMEPYGDAVERLQDLLDLVDDTSLIDKAVVVLRAERDGLVFESIYRKGQLAEQMGKPRKAREHYIEAVFWLRKDGTPDSYQADKIELAEKQIERLGGRPTG